MPRLGCIFFLFKFVVDFANEKAKLQFYFFMEYNILKTINFTCLNYRFSANQYAGLFFACQ